MKTSKIIIIAVLTVLASGCKKDNASRLRLFAEDMNNGNGSKVWVDPTSTNSASSTAIWVENEKINLNGNEAGYPIAYDSEGDYFYLNTGDYELPDDLYAVYPATTSANGNKVTVTNNNDGSGNVVIERLAVNFRNGGHDIVFPMVATGSRNSMRLLFKHLTGGMMLTLTNTSTTQDANLKSVKIVTYGENSAAGPLTAYNFTTSWAVQGPVLPSGQIGQINGDRAVGYASEMHFTLTDNGNAGKEVAKNNGQIKFCVPVTVSKIKKLEITGYDMNGAQVFVKTKTLDSELTVVANEMYTIPEIQF